MHFRMTSALTLVLLAAPLAHPAPCSAAPNPQIAERPLHRHGGPATLAAAARPAAQEAKTSAVGPVFQAVGYFGDLAVIDPHRMDTAALFITPDAGFSSAFVTGLARQPVSGEVFIAGNDASSTSFLGTVDFTTGQVTTIGSIAGDLINDIAFDGTGNLYGLTDNTNGNNPHTLMAINTTTAEASVVKVLDPHFGTSDSMEGGAIAYNLADGNIYYADVDLNSRIFVDKLAAGTFAQTAAFTSSFNGFGIPNAMAFTQGRLWLFVSSGHFVSADAANLGSGLDPVETVVHFPTPDGGGGYFADGFFPNTLPCVPSVNVACLVNRFKVEVSYDATPHNGSGPANVVLESSASVKFTFFDPNNIEMILKVLDACSLSSNWWVFAGGLTNVGVTIKVTDTKTGAFKTYTSKKKQLFQPFADTAAFPCP